jgi:GMP synthase (glutamine-hydrolysing)
MAKQLAHDPQVVLVVDFGAQYAPLIARRAREAQVYSEIVPHKISAQEVLKRKPIAIILSGGPASVHVDGAPVLDPQIYELGIPILGICYGAQLIAEQLGGKVSRGGRGEYGRTVVQRIAGAVSQLLKDDVPSQLNVWMSHFDAVSVLPSGFVATASTQDAPMAVIENPEKKIWGVQYHPEVVHTEHGQSIIEQFLHRLVGAKRDWTMSSIVVD